MAEWQNGRDGRMAEMAEWQRDGRMAEMAEWQEIFFYQELFRNEKGKKS